MNNFDFSRKNQTYLFRWKSVIIGNTCHNKIYQSSCLQLYIYIRLKPNSVRIRF